VAYLRSRTRFYGPTLHRKEERDPRSQRGEGIQGKGREHVKWDMYA